MKTFCSLLLVITLFSLSVEAESTSRNLSDDGVTITIPLGWKQMDQSMMRDFSNLGATKLGSGLSRGKTNNWMIYDATNSEELVAIGLTSVHHEFTIDNNSLMKYKESLIKPFKQIGISVSNIETSIEHFGSHPSAHVKFSLGYPLLGRVIEGYLFRGKGKSYSFSVVSTDSNYGKLQATVSELFSAMTIDGRSAIVEYWEAIPDWVFGALVVGVIMLFSYLRKRRLQLQG